MTKKNELVHATVSSKVIRAAKGPAKGSKAIAKKTPVAKSFSVFGQYVFVDGNTMKNGSMVIELPRGCRPGALGSKVKIGPLLKGVAMAARGRETVVDDRPATATEQLQREKDAEKVREDCTHKLKLSSDMPVHYEGEWVCDDCDVTSARKRMHCRICFVDVCVRCFAKRAKN